MTSTSHTVQARRRAAGGRMTLLLALLQCLCAVAHADATLPAKPNQSWRCTGPTGTVTYSQQPCEGGAELKQMGDERSTSQLRQSRDNGLRDAKLARQMQRERRHEERMASLQRPVALSTTKPHVIRATPNTHKPKPLSDATRPVKVKADKKAPGRNGATNAQEGSALRP